jgi:tRNA(Ile)-lysidine synthase
MLFEKFKSFINEKKLLPANNRVLLAVSGGIDSSVMMHLFYRLGIYCEVAHCNFQLRGNESDGDEAFVREIAARYEFPLFITRFETLEYASENKLSIQMAARELRYTWFRKLAQAHHIEKIAIAHNRDDAMETFFINLGRGRGSAGLTGMRTITDHIVRPLLFASRTEIEQYSRDNDINFREDSSNAEDKYMRNYIRHKILPAFEEIIPHFRDLLTRNMDRLNDAHILYRYALDHIIPSLVSEEKDILYIDIPKLELTPCPKTVLFEILKKYDFLASSIDEIYELFHASAGKQFFSNTHKLIKDRNRFIVSKITTETNTKFYIEDGTASMDFPIPLQFDMIQRPDNFAIDKDPSIAQLDYDKLSFPLILRKWQHGDYFTPLGMNGLKKISDFFIDMKLSLIEKENTWLLLSGNQIVWIIGKRIDNRFKVTDTTQKICVIKECV